MRSSNQTRQQNSSADSDPAATTPDAPATVSRRPPANASLQTHNSFAPAPGYAPDFESVSEPSPGHSPPDQFPATRHAPETPDRSPLASAKSGSAANAPPAQSRQKFASSTAHQSTMPCPNTSHQKSPATATDTKTIPPPLAKSPASPTALAPHGYNSQTHSQPEGRLPAESPPQLPKCSNSPCSAPGPADAAEPPHTQSPDPQSPPTLVHQTPTPLTNAIPSFSAPPAAVPNFFVPDPPATAPQSTVFPNSPTPPVHSPAQISTKAPPPRLSPSPEPSSANAPHSIQSHPPAPSPVTPRKMPAESDPPPSAGSMHPDSPESPETPAPPESPQTLPRCISPEKH